MNEIKKNTLYIVPTPIGNLADITLRALEVLKNVDIIACEDTRHSLKLFNHYEIKKKLIAYHSYNEKNSSNGIIKLLKNGEIVALVSDSGTPLISDPGFLLVKECRENNIDVISLPGPTAFVTLLSASGFRTDKFFFHGFLSPKAGKQTKALVEMSKIEATHIIYESPYRILKLLDNISKIFSKKMLCIGKELTKLNEKIIIGDTENIKNLMEKEKIIGEFAILIANY